MELGNDDLDLDLDLDPVCGLWLGVVYNAYCWMYILYSLCSYHLRASPPLQLFICPSPIFSSLHLPIILSISSSHRLLISPYPHLLLFSPPPPPPPSLSPLTLHRFTA